MRKSLAFSHLFVMISIVHQNFKRKGGNKVGTAEGNLQLDSKYRLSEAGSLLLSLPVRKFSGENF